MESESVFSPSFVRYLSSKKSVDDRALNQNVWQKLHHALRQPPFSERDQLNVLEIGSGIGTMVERVIEWELFDQPVHYTAIDEIEENTLSAKARLGQAPFDLHLETAEFYEFASRPSEKNRYDLIISNAFLDLVHLPSALESLYQMLRPGGLFYLTITFDGVTGIEPKIDQAFDRLIEDCYHADMDQRRFRDLETGGSRAGRSLIYYILQSGATLLEAGSSDWIVYPTSNRYFADEAYFLKFIVHTMQTALAGHPKLDAEKFDNWIATRFQQIDRGELIYVAHQLDVLGQTKM